MRPDTLQVLEETAKTNGLTSKWGYHPCTYDVFKRLRRLHKAFWKYQKRFKAAERWAAKIPKNRNGDCPVYPEYMKCKLRYEPNRRPFRDTDNHSIRKWYQLARIPQEHPVEPFNQHVIVQIDSWLAELDVFELEHSSK
jgi:hypothetical protein